MIDLGFAVVDVRPERHSVVPTLAFRLQIREASGRPMHAILLRCQLQIESRRRRHDATERERLTSLFGEPGRWGDTLKPLLWTSTTLLVPAFSGNVEVDLPVACTYDFEVGAARYLGSLGGGDVPLLFLFSGTAFAKTETGFQVEPVPWDKEATFRMPLAVWRELMDAHFPDSTWMRMRRESFEALERFRTRHALMSWDDTIEALLR